MRKFFVKIFFHFFNRQKFTRKNCYHRQSLFPYNFNACDKKKAADFLVLGIRSREHHDSRTDCGIQF